MSTLTILALSWVILGPIAAQIISWVDDIPLQPFEYVLAMLFGWLLVVVLVYTTGLYWYIARQELKSRRERDGTGDH